MTATVNSGSNVTYTWDFGDRQPASGLENWAYEWAVPLENQVSHTLLVRATDQAGLQAISEPVEVIVNSKSPNQLYLPIIMK